MRIRKGKQVTDYYTKQRKRNMLVGGFVIVAFCIFLWLIFIFGELPVAVSGLRSFEVLVNFPQAPGVQKNTAVKYLGYQVGRVIGVTPPFLFTDSITGKKYHQIKVTLAIDKQFRDIPSNVDIVIVKRSMASSYVDLQVDPNKALEPMDPKRPETRFLTSNMPPLYGTTGMKSEFFPKDVKEKLEKLTDSVTRLADSANEIIGDKANQANIRQSLANINAATAQATETLKSLKSFADTGEDRIKQTADKLAAALDEINVILTRINEGDGSMSKLINDPQLYENLLDSSQELQLALEQLKILAADMNKKGIKLKW